MSASPEVDLLLRQVSEGRGDRIVEDAGTPTGFNIKTLGPNGEDGFVGLNFSSRKLAEIAVSKITWIKGGTVQRSEDGRRLTVTAHRL